MKLKSLILNIDSCTNWVRDSIVRMNLAIEADYEGATDGDDGIGEYAFLDSNEEDMTVYEKYMYDNYTGLLKIIRVEN